jgi:hypothetical protein
MSRISRPRRRCFRRFRWLTCCTESGYGNHQHYGTASARYSGGCRGRTGAGPRVLDGCGPAGRAGLAASTERPQQTLAAASANDMGRPGGPAGESPAMAETPAARDAHREFLFPGSRRGVLRSATRLLFSGATAKGKGPLGQGPYSAGIGPPAGVGSGAGGAGSAASGPGRAAWACSDAADWFPPRLQGNSFPSAQGPAEGEKGF